jgi:hypothetical protein
MTHPFDPRLAPFLAPSSGASTRARAALFSEVAPSATNGPSDDDAKSEAAVQSRIVAAFAKLVTLPPEELADALEELVAARLDAPPPGEPPALSRAMAAPGASDRTRTMAAIDRAMGLGDPTAEPVTIGPAGQLRISHLDPIARAPR